MEPIASFSGLASGIQWRDMIDEIMRVESRPITLLQGRIADIGTRSTAWTTLRGKLDTLDGAAESLSTGNAFRSFAVEVSGYADQAPLSATTSTTAQAGSYRVAVHEVATREKLGGAGFASSTEALGLEGEFLLDGARIQVVAEDGLAEVAEAVNRVASESGVRAAVAPTSSGGARLVLTATESGGAGIDLVDGIDGVLRGLGFLDGTLAVKHATSDGAATDAFDSRATPVATLLGLTSAPPATAVLVGGESVTLDLSTMGLDDVAQAIDQAAITAGKAFRAQVVQETDDAGRTVYRLDLDGTTALSDAGGVLESLGLLVGGRAAVAQRIASATSFEDAATGLAATGATLLSELRVGGSDAGVATGDTLTLRGIRGDGTTFDATFTVGAGDTLDTLTGFLTAGGDDFGSGRTATVGVSAAGALVVTDGVAGGSLLDLSITANNEGGGTLDFGELSVTDEGRSREIVSGRDALVEVDGTFVRSASNTLADAVPGLSLALSRATGEVLDLEVSRESDAAVDSVTTFVDAYNDVQGWISQQFGGAGAADGVAAAPLSGDSTLRGIRNRLRNVMISQLVPAATDGARRLVEVGIEIDRTGAFQLDTDSLRNALESDPEGVERLFTSFGGTDEPLLEYVASTDATQEGDWTVEISTVADVAQASGSGFGSGLGVYQDDGLADTLVVRDLDTDSSYRVSLDAGDDVDAVAQALNDAFATATRRRLEASEALWSDAGGTAATAGTTLADLHSDAGASLDVAAGDTLTISGTSGAGGSVLVDFAVDDPATVTVQDLLAAVSSALGGGVAARLEGGRLVVEEPETGRSLMSLAISSDNAGGGTFTLGTVDVTESGRTTVGITASVAGGELRLTHMDYGALDGFEVSYEAGGIDGTASLGLAAGVYRGTDVAGTIGGHAATGVGRLLKGADGTPAEGLMLSWTGDDTGTVGTTTFSRGIAARMEKALLPFLGSEAGSIEALSLSLDDQVTALESRIDDLNGRLERRQEQLVRQFTAMEEAMARAQSQTNWLTSQLARLNGTSGS